MATFIFMIVAVVVWDLVERFVIKNKKRPVAHPYKYNYNRNQR